MAAAWFKGVQQKTGFCHESVHKQHVWFLRNRESCVRDAGDDIDSERDGKFWELKVYS